MIPVTEVGVEGRNRLFSPVAADAGTPSGQLVRRAGPRTAVQPRGTSLVTTDPAPILANRRC